MGEYLAAAVQPRFEPDPAANLEKLVRLVGEAAVHGAKLVVLPECASGAGYIFADAMEARRLAEPVPGPFSNAMSRLASGHRIFVVAGLAELDGEAVFNTALLVGSSGALLGKYRKNYLVSFDKRWFIAAQEEDPFPVWETPLGRLGIMICGDARLPEIARTLALKGAEVICYPTLWGAPDQYLYNCPTRAVENRVWFIASDKVGRERGMDYPGQSFIMDPTGQYQAQASEDREEIIYARIHPAAARDKHLADGTDLFSSRRPDTYSLLTKTLSDLRMSDQLHQAVVPQTTNILAACVELDVGGSAKEQLIPRAAALVEDAARLYSKVILLPGLYPADLSRSAAAAWAEPAGGPGPMRQVFLDVARRLGVYVAYGTIEADQGALFKTTVLVGPGGDIVGRYRAIHLFESERRWASPGQEYVVCDTDFGPVGLLSGLDGYHFETARSLTLLGADAILWPSTFHSPQERDLLPIERAIENKVFVMTASRSHAAGGGTVIVDPRGFVLARATGTDQIIKAQVQLVLARCKEALPLTDLLLDRRPECYRSLAYPRVP